MIVWEIFYKGYYIKIFNRGEPGFAFTTYAKIGEFEFALPKDILLKESGDIYCNVGNSKREALDNAMKEIDYL